MPSNNEKKKRVAPSERLVGSAKSFPLTRINLISMAIAGALIVIGFLLMLGGSSDESAFNPDIFSTRRIVIGPAIALAGFVYMGIAVMLKSKKQKGGAE